MNKLQQQRQQIDALKRRIAQLEAEKAGVQFDITFVAGKVAEVWKYMDLDFSKVNVNSEKPSFIEMTKATMPIIKKIVGGKIQIPVIIQKFEEVAPTLNKYKHLVMADKPADEQKQLSQPQKRIGDV